jgi:release factor glutamine methyltransferase
MDIPLSFIAVATRLLKPQGFLAIEHHESQPDAIAAALSLDFSEITLHHDLAGRPRFTTAVRNH